jgi:hypothetical protein
MEAAAMGGWTPFTKDISKEAASVFETALAGQVGVKYAPLAVATQVVAGTNYKFFCNTSTVTANAPPETAMIYILQPPQQAKPVLTDIRRITE